MESRLLLRLNGWPTTRPSPWTVGMAAVCSLFLSRLVFVSAILPPWQNPDEPAHFAVVRALAQETSVALSKRRNLTVQAEVLISMAEHGWWEAYEEAVPDPLPTEFLEIPEHLGDASEAPPLYYVLASRYCRLIGAESLLAQYGALRAASILTSLITLWIIILAAREWFDETVAICAGALVALVPQFALMSISVSPEPLVYLCGALVWWQAARLFSGRAIGGPMAIMVAATIVAVLTKRLAAPLALQTGLLMLLGAISGARSRGHRISRIAGASVAILAVALATVTFVEPQVGLARLQGVWDFMFARTELFSRDGSYFLGFSWMIFSSAYLAGGWMRFFAPTAVVALALTVAVLGWARGIGVSLLRSDQRLRRSAGIAALFAVIQLAAVYGTIYYNPANGAQGRMLFASIGPFAALCAIGLTRWDSTRVRTIVCTAAVSLLLVLDLVSWTTVIVPAYAR